MRRSLGIFVCVALVAAGCGTKNSVDTKGTSTQGSGGKKLQIAVIPKGTTHVFWKSVHAGAEKAAKELGDIVLVDIPEQDVVSGLVRLKVSEAKVERLEVTGSRFFSLGRIKAAVPGLAEGTVPHLPTVQKEVALRLASTPRHKDYGALTLFTQLRYHVTIVHVVSRHCFFPEPGVDSAILALTKRINGGTHGLDDRKAKTKKYATWL